MAYLSSFINIISYCFNAYYAGFRRSEEIEMRAVCVYVDGGKGHYVPAEAVKEALEGMGHTVALEEFFDYLDIRWLGAINKWWWRKMLKNSKLERKLSRHNDSDTNGMETAVRFGIKHCERAFVSNMKESPVDFFFCTHPYASTVLSAMLKNLDMDIPVYYFATDVFSAPVATISDDIRKFYISTEEGAERVKKMGQRPETIEIAPFPLQANVANSPRLTKTEARARLKLSDMFTMQLNLGGEGIGSLALLESLYKENLPVQVVVLGGIDKAMKKKLERIENHYKGSSVKLVIAGFVNNVNEYLAASDIIAGRAGINTIVEAMYAHRPFMVTELVYTVIPSAEYIEKYHVGWNCTDDVAKQIRIIKDLVNDKEKIISLDSNFDKIPIVYSASKLAEIVVNDVESVRKNGQN